MFNTLIKPSVVVLVIAGILLLIGLTTLSQNVLTMWIAAKLLYGVGVVLFLFNK